MLTQKIEQFSILIQHNDALWQHVPNNTLLEASRRMKHHDDVIYDSTQSHDIRINMTCSSTDLSIMNDTFRNI
ncbi:hypothetical protein [Acinetobacter sp. YH12128]|uniref:hypothetical protein n=1 Tax=Acinetobacter sp. YH12128 TaxID=2601113 RepID=UPI0015D10697|nr:hypothetical protein [Acinetobacter sp. YH12128]